MYRITALKTGVLDLYICVKHSEMHRAYVTWLASFFKNIFRNQEIHRHKSRRKKLK